MATPIHATTIAACIAAILGASPSVLAEDVNVASNVSEEAAATADEPTSEEAAAPTEEAAAPAESAAIEEEVELAAETKSTIEEVVIGFEDILQFSLEELLDSEVSIGAIRERKLSEVPYDLTVVSSKEIKRGHYLNLPSALDLRAGISSTHINTAQDQLSIRGSNAFQKGTIRLLINGNAHNFDVFNITPWTTLPLILSLVDRIEIVKGSVPFYGRNALSGAININYRKSTDRDVLTMESGLGTYGRSFAVTSYEGRLDNGVNVVSAVQYQSVDNSFGFNKDHSADKSNDTLRDPSEFGANYLSPKDNINNYRGLTFYQSIYKKYGEDSALFYVGGAYTPNSVLRLPDRLCKTWVSSFSHYAGAKYSFNLDSLNTFHELAVYSTGNSVRWVKNGTTESKFLTYRNPNFSAYQDEGYQTPSYYRQEINANLATGFSYGDERQNSVTVTPLLRWTMIDQQNFFGTSNIKDHNPTDRLTTRPADNKGFLEEGISVQIRQELMEGLTGTVDIRADDNYKVGLTYGALAAVTYRLMDAANIRISASTMTRAPEVEEIDAHIMQYLGSSSKTGQYLDNQNLDPESALTFDLGLMGQIGTHVNYSATGYFSQRKDIIEFQYLGAVTDPLGKEIPRYRFENANNVDLIGANLESSIVYDPLEFRFGVTYQEIIKADGMLSGITEGRYGGTYLSPLQAFAQVYLHAGDFLIGARGKYVQEHVWLWPGWKKSDSTAGTAAKESFKEKTVASYSPIDVSLDYVPASSPISAYAVVRNVLGERYNTWRFDKSDNYLGTEFFVGAKLEY